LAKPGFRRAKAIARWGLRQLGYDIVRGSPAHASGYPIDFTPLHVEIDSKVRPYTITSAERVYSLVEAVRYLHSAGIAGDFVECGVYKGGSMMAVALTLLDCQETDRDLHLYDTFEGMPRPGEMDVDAWGQPASATFEKQRTSEDSSGWVNCSLDSVRAAMQSTGYPLARTHFHKGLVEETIPSPNLSSIALLRLDTDWYSSTLHELQYLYPLVSKGGMVLIDDYGHYQGAKQAVDEFFNARGQRPFLHRIDYSSRLLIKGLEESV
jgi:O-methyltransferase